MDTQTGILEERLKTFLAQLQAESGILDRVVYKGKNQHRRCPYFQYLLKVRRDVKLLQSARLDEILDYHFQVINGKDAKQTVHLLESLKRRKCNTGKHNFQERLLGIARQLSEMVEPMVKAAVEISTLLARSFFMGFSLIVLALLARLRALVQQILLDVVSVFNMISSVSQKEHFVKLTQDGIEVFREYHPSKEEITTLECVWEGDKFVLLERKNKNDAEVKNPRLEEILAGTEAIQYQSIEAILGEDENELGCKTDSEHTTTENLPDPGTKQHENDESADPSFKIGGEKHGKPYEKDDHIGNAGSPSKLFNMDGVVAGLKWVPSPISSKPQSVSETKPAFVPVREPAPSKTNELGSSLKAFASDCRLSSTNDEKDPFFSLLTGGNTKDSLF